MTEKLNKPLIDRLRELGKWKKHSGDHEAGDAMLEAAARLEKLEEDWLWARQFISKLTPKSVEDFTDCYIVVSGREIDAAAELTDHHESCDKAFGSLMALEKLGIEIGPGPGGRKWRMKGEA